MKQIVFKYEHFPSATTEEIKDEFEWQKEINGMEGTLEENREELERIVLDSYYERFMDDQGNEFETAGIPSNIGVLLFYNDREQYEEELSWNRYDNIDKEDTFYTDFRKLCEKIWYWESRDSQPKDIILTYDVATMQFDINRNIEITAMTTQTHDDIVNRVKNRVAGIQAEFDLDNAYFDAQL